MKAHLRVEVFSPKEIYRMVWEDTPIGSEGTIAVHIRHLREKLEDNPSEPRYLKVDQVAGEFEERFAEKKLSVYAKYCVNDIAVMADGNSGRWRFVQGCVKPGMCLTIKIICRCR